MSDADANFTASEKLQIEIAKVEKRIATRETELKQLQAQWRDWEAGNLRTLIGGDRRMLAHLRGQLAASTPAGDTMRSSQMFYGSNF
jgi:hypothetical protein